MSRAPRGAVRAHALVPRYGLDFEDRVPRMDAKFPILGFLMESEMTGYDLKCQFRDSVGFFYRVSDGSLYPALKRLLRDGFVSMRAERHGRRVRKVYAITPAGRRRFLALLSEPSPPMLIHDEAMVKVFFAHHDPTAAIEHLSRMRQFNAQVAEVLARVVKEMDETGDNPFHKLTAELGMEVTRFEAQVLGRLGKKLSEEISRLESDGARSKPLPAVSTAK